jgi:N-methylhydantoinase A/oxoprolinase/acetone carboxylase beta subunit
MAKLFFGYLVGILVYISIPLSVKAQIEQDRLELERERTQQELQLAREKLRLEERKAWISSITTIVPLVVAAGSIVYGVWSQRDQAEKERVRRQEEARLQFELKAAEIVFSDVKSPYGTKNKATALKALFGDRLPANFIASFDPEEHSSFLETIGQIGNFHNYGVVSGSLEKVESQDEESQEDSINP